MSEHLPQQKDYSKCKIDHKDGVSIRPHFRSVDYFNTYNLEVAELLAKYGLPMPLERDVYRGTHRDLLFLSKFGVVVRIGQMDMSHVLHPGNLQPLDWSTTPDGKISLAIYPGIVIERSSMQFCSTHQVLKDFHWSTHQDVSEIGMPGNLGLIGLYDGRTIPMLVDVDHETAGTVSTHRYKTKRDKLVFAQKRRVMPARAIRQIMLDVYGDDEDFSQWLEAYDVHQPLRRQLWDAVCEENSEQRLNKLGMFWQRCSRLIVKPEKVIVHDWECRQYSCRKEVKWIQGEARIFELALYRPWTGEPEDNKRKAFPLLRVSRSITA